MVQPPGTHPVGRDTLDARHEAVFLYDGGCGFCTRWARWLGVRAAGRVRIAPFQEVDLDPFGLDQEDLREASFLIDEAGRAHRGARGITAALRRSARPWSTIGAALDLPVLRGFAGVVYVLVSRNRRRLPSPRL